MSTRPTSNENQGTKAQGGLPGWQFLSMMSHIILGELSTVHASPWGEETRKSEPHLSWTPLYVPFPSADLDLPPFAVIDQNPEDNSLAEFRESSGPKAVPGAPRGPVTSLQQAGTVLSLPAGQRLQDLGAQPRE